MAIKEQFNKDKKADLPAVTVRKKVRNIHFRHIRISISTLTMQASPYLTSVDEKEEIAKQKPNNNWTEPLARSLSSAHDRRSVDRSLARLNLAGYR
jgi:hypothetical protein